MITDAEGKNRGAYTYANGERVSVEDLGQVEGKPNNPLYYLSDALGSTIAITNMNAGIIDSKRFAPFGEPLSPVAKNARLTNSPFGFTGENHDIEGGLIYLRARYYEPEIVRFLSEDSYEGQISNPLSMNLYSYCENNPMLYTDPSGHKIKVSQYGILAWEFLWEGINITTRNMGFDIIGNLKSMTSAINMVAKGEFDLKEIGINTISGDLKYVIKHWYIISNKKTYSNKVIRKFARHLAGAYEEVINIGAFVYGTAKGVKFKGAKIKGVSRIIPEIADSQLGKKLVDHAADYGLTISKGVLLLIRR